MKLSVSSSIRAKPDFSTAFSSYHLRFLFIKSQFPSTTPDTCPTSVAASTSFPTAPHHFHLVQPLALFLSVFPRILQELLLLAFPLLLQFDLSILLFRYSLLFLFYSFIPNFLYSYVPSFLCSLISFSFIPLFRYSSIYSF